MRFGGFMGNGDGGFTLAMEASVMEGGCTWWFHG